MLLHNAEGRYRYLRAFTSLGVVCVGLSVLVGRIGDALPYIHFIEGLLLGLGVTMGTVGFINDLKSTAADRS